MRVGPQRRLSTEELMLLNCDAGEGLIIPWTARRSNQPIVKEINPSNQYFFIRKTDAEAEALLLWPPVAKS